jgi:hypothetical protein
MLHSMQRTLMRKKASAAPIITRPRKSGTPTPEYLTKEELRKFLNLPSIRKIDQMMARRMIPFLRWGSKTVRFEADKVKAALAKFEIAEIGRAQK